MEKEAYDHATTTLILYTAQYSSVHSSVFFCTQLSILMYTAQYSYVHSSVFLCVTSVL